MQYNSNLPQSMTSPLLSDRQNQKINNLAQSWATSTGEKHHLNPSKSKINVKTFLNKTGENFCLSHPNLDNVRGSCYLGNPPKPFPSTHRNSYNQQKLPKNKRISQQVSTQTISKEIFPKFTFTPVSGSETDERKKSDSSYLRSSLKQGFTPKNEEDNVKSKEERAITQLRSQILSLTKKVFLNQQQISKIKERKEKQKDKKWQSLQQEFTQFQIQMFDICKKNTNYFSEFENKIERNNKIIAELKTKNIDILNQQYDKDEVMKKINQCETRISELAQIIKIKQDSTIKNVAAQLNMEESLMKKYVNEHVGELKIKIDKSWSDKTSVMFRIDKLEKQLLQKNIDQYFKKNHKKAFSSIAIERKEFISVKQGENSVQKVKRLGDKNSTPRKEFEELSNQMSSSRNKADSNSSSKSELLVNKSVYYIDPYGYILDENRFYLLNAKKQQIMLPQRMLAILKENKMLIGGGNYQSNKRQ